MKNLNESMKEGEAKKRQLEEALDALQEEVILSSRISNLKKTLNFVVFFLELNLISRNTEVQKIKL